MTHTDIDQFREFYEMTEQVDAAKNGDNFTQFIHFCVERLRKGDQVQVIWNDYQQLVRHRDL